MSTRCCIEFCEGDDVWATVYRHCDGYPEGEVGVPADLLRFMMDLKENANYSNFFDACFLSAKFIVWQASEYSENGNGHPCDFSSLGISPSAEAHGDLEYIYRVTCGDVPKVSWREAGESKVWSDCLFDLQAGTIEVEGTVIKVEAKSSAVANKICAFVRKALA